MIRYPVCISLSFISFSNISSVEPDGETEEREGREGRSRRIESFRAKMGGIPLCVKNFSQVICVAGTDTI